MNIHDADEKDINPGMGLDEKHLSEPEDQGTDAEQSIDNLENNVENEIAHLKDQLLRALAEAENIRRRSEREREETSRYAITKFSRDLLSIGDNLSRALDFLPEDEGALSEPVRNFIEGVRLTGRELTSVFERHGIEKINPKGEKFDHNFHQAMFETETDDCEPGTVMQVLQVGYILHGRLLRPAMVGVSKSVSSGE